MRKYIPSRTLLLVSVLNWCPICTGSTADFDAVREKMERDVLDFARAIESYHAQRCDSNTLEDCSETNYHETLSALPGPQCNTSGDLSIDICGEACGALWDYTTSSVRIPDNLAVDTTNYYPKDPRAVEVICYSAFMDDYLQEKRQSDQAFWDQYGLPSPQSYFGSSTGAFRIYPGRTSNETGVYDPRNRPWYIAASSGPKNVILILDTSGSMNTFNRIGKLKIAAKQVITSLTVADRIAIVEFSSEGRKIGQDSGKYVYTATKENTDILLREIDQLEASGSTNTYDAFVKAFEILDDSYEKELTVECTTAILFLTDGRTTEPISFANDTDREKYVTDLVIPELERLRAKHDVQLFTYSIGETEVHAFPKALACDAGGVWSRLIDNDDIFEALTSYYQLFALGLGTGPNENFTAWVEPYRFATGGILGTTVSAPVYDRTRKSLSQFLGVVGIDFPLEALNRALGVSSDNTTALLNLLVNNSWARCPTFNLTLCELESFRRRGVAGNQGLCTQSCGVNDFVDIEATQCATIDDIPQVLWADTSFSGLDYTNRVCCRDGETTPANTCSTSKSPSSWSTGKIVGLTVGCVVALVMVTGIGYWVVWNRCSANQAQGGSGRFDDVQPVAPPNRAQAQGGGEGFVDAHPVDPS